MPGELREIERRLWHDEREIRRLRILLQQIATASGVRATQIVGVIPATNLPATAMGGTFVYISFGDEPSAGLAHSGTNAVGYAMDLIVQT